MNWFQIGAEIAAKAGMFEQFYAKKPGKLLLGKDQWDTMLEHFRLSGIQVRGDEGEHRAMYNGLQIYQVDDRSYVEVCS